MSFNSDIVVRKIDDEQGHSMSHDEFKSTLQVYLENFFQVGDQLRCDFMEMSQFLQHDMNV